MTSSIWQHVDKRLFVNFHSDHTFNIQHPCIYSSNLTQKLHICYTLLEDSMATYLAVVL